MTQGYLVSIEGIDGSGKSSLVNKLSEDDINGDYNELVKTVEPTQNKTGQLLREFLTDESTDPIAELHLFMADHASHVTRAIEPNLKENNLIITDRYIDSRCAYQGYTLDGIIQNPVEYVHQLHQDWTIFPDLTIYLSVDVETAVERTSSGEKFERQDRLEEIDSNYRTVIEMEPSRFEIVDANQPIEQVYETVVSTLGAKLSVKQ